MDDEELAVEYFLGCAADPPPPEQGDQVPKHRRLSRVAGGSTGKLTIWECS